jgi:hypothetical protein
MRCAAMRSCVPGCVGYYRNPMLCSVKLLANQCHRDRGGPAWLPAVADEGYEQRTLLVGDYASSVTLVILSTVVTREGVTTYVPTLRC